MPIGLQLGRTDGAFEQFNGTATVGQTTLAVQTTLVSAATRATATVNVVTPVAGSTAFVLPMNAAQSQPIVVANYAATAVPLQVFPPWNDATAAAAGGRIFVSSAVPAANAVLAVAQNERFTFYPRPNGIDFDAVKSA